MDKKIDTLIFIKNSTDPSAFYRITQYFENQDNICYCKYSSDWIYRWYYDIGKKRPKKINGFVNIIRKGILAAYGILHNSFFVFYWKRKDVKNIVINRTAFPRVFPFYVSKSLMKLLMNRNVIWDFDDNIIENKEISTKELKILMNYSSKIVVSNTYLKEMLPVEIRNKVKILCTTDRTFENNDIELLIYNRMKSYSQQIVLIWVGTRDNVKYLNSTMDILDQTAKELKECYGKQLVLWCVSNMGLGGEYKWIRVENLIWSRETAVERIREAHIGLMPLECNQYTLGKAGFKAVQYISSGMPALVSDVGYCKEVIMNEKNGFVVSKMDEWREGILRLATNENLYIQYSLEARKVWEDKFDSDVNQIFWEELTKS